MGFTEVCPMGCGILAAGALGTNIKMTRWIIHFWPLLHLVAMLLFHALIWGIQERMFTLLAGPRRCLFILYSCIVVLKSNESFAIPNVLKVTCWKRFNCGNLWQLLCSCCVEWPNILARFLYTNVACSCMVTLAMSFTFTSLLRGRRLHKSRSRVSPTRRLRHWWILVRHSRASSTLEWALLLSSLVRVREQMFSRCFSVGATISTTTVPKNQSKPWLQVWFVWLHHAELWQSIL